MGIEILKKNAIYQEHGGFRCKFVCSSMRTNSCAVSEIARRD